MFKTAFKGGVWLGVGFMASIYLILSGIFGAIRVAFDPEYTGAGLGWHIFFGLLGAAFLVWDIITYRKSAKMLVEAEDELNAAMFEEFGVSLDADFDAKASVK